MLFMLVPTMKQRTEAIQTRLRLIAPQIIQARVPFAPVEYRPLRAPGFRTDAIDYDSPDAGWSVIPPGSYWGTWQTHFEMRTGYQIPADWDTHATLALHLPFGDAKEFEHPEALVSIDGVSLAAMDTHHQVIMLPEAFKDHAPHALYLRGWTGLGGGFWGMGDKQTLYMESPAVVLIDLELEQFVTAAQTALDTVKLLDDLQPAKYDLLTALESAFYMLDLRHPLGAGFRESINSALIALKMVLKNSGVPHPLTVHGVGHAHIDTAWMWSTRETRGKVERTFHTALHMMEEYPEYIFVQSQPQLYDWFREAHPERFEDIKRKVAAGQWEPLGGMWVEADCNLTGAESLVRQFMLGRQFFKDHFGDDAETPILWLPDVFGYPASIPQIAAQAGMKYFFTIKLRWSEVNYFPYDTFWWQGIDGSRLLAHMSTIPYNGNPEDWATYNATPLPSSALNGWARQANKHHRDVLMSYGWGDGGGGPTREMLESMRAMREMPAVPRHRTTTVRDFYRLMQARYGDTLPIWNGELYLETHQGTLTSQTRIKRWNHDAEVLLHDVEFLATFASLLDPAYVYPHDEFHWAWRIVCLNQFHDILPGSSIGAVYEDAGVQFGEVTARLEVVKAAALAVITPYYDADVLVINTIAAHRAEVVALSTPTATGSSDLISSWVPELGVQAIKIENASPQDESSTLTATATLLENSFVRIELNSRGDITCIYHHGAERELLPKGGIANQFQAYDDHPANFDAWNVEPPALAPLIALAQPAESVRVVEHGSLRATLEITRRILDSRITQRITLTFNSALITFETEIDWQEKFALLKVAFPLAVHAKNATYGIQWGHVERPTHSNTTWDAAQYEVAHHGWFDLSESGFGVSLLDDGIYGCDARENIMRLTLVKRASTVDPVGDSGLRRMRYALAPHSDSAKMNIIVAAAQLSHPLIVAPARRQPTPPAVPPRFPLDQALVSLETTFGALVETIKRSEDGTAVIVRLYETGGTRQQIQVTFAFPVASVHRANILEVVNESLTVHADQRVKLTITPFEIVTLRVVPAF